MDRCLGRAAIEVPRFNRASVVVSFNKSISYPLNSRAIWLHEEQHVRQTAIILAFNAQDVA